MTRQDVILRLGEPDDILAGAGDRRYLAYRTHKLFVRITGEIVDGYGRLGALGARPVASPIDSGAQPRQPGPPPITAMEYLAYLIARETDPEKLALWKEIKAEWDSAACRVV